MTGSNCWRAGDFQSSFEPRPTLRPLQHTWKATIFPLNILIYTGCDAFMVSFICVFYCFAGFRLRYRAILRLLFLLHHPTGSALPVLLCRPASRGENHLGKGRPSRTYRKFPRADLVVFRKLSSRHFSHSEKIL